MKRSENIIVHKSFQFTSLIIDLAEDLRRKNYVISNQILRSGTSIGANVHEAQCAQSRNDFMAKMYISFKECSETRYWLELIKVKNFYDNNKLDEIIDLNNELYKILSSITRKK